MIKTDSNGSINGLLREIRLRRMLQKEIIELKNETTCYYIETNSLLEQQEKMINHGKQQLEENLNITRDLLYERDDVILGYQNALLAIIDYQVDVTADIDEEIGNMRNLARNAIEVHMDIEQATRCDSIAQRPFRSNLLGYAAKHLESEINLLENRLKNGHLLAEQKATVENDLMKYKEEYGMLRKLGSTEKVDIVEERLN